MSLHLMNIGDVCDLSTGGTPSRTQPEYFDNGDIRWLVSGDINKREIFDCEGRITELGFKHSNAKFLPLNSVLIALNGQGKTRGTVALLRTKATCNQSLVSIFPKNGVQLDTKYLFYNLDSKYDEIRRLTGDSGNDRRGLNMPLIRKIKIPLPPLATQQKIVAKLDAVFAEIDKSTAAAEANAGNAEALFQSYLTEVFERGGEGWITTVLDKVCKVDRGSSPRPIKEYFTEGEDGVNWIKIGDTEEGGKYIFSTNQKITKVGAEKSRYVEVGDFILTNSMSYGRPYIMRINGYIHDGWFVLRLNKDIDSEYFFYLLTSPYVQNQFQSLAAGSVVKNISGDLLKKTILPIPPLLEQKKLAEIFSDKQTVLKRLSEVYAEKKVELDLLKQSILKQAFTGELIKE